MKNCYQLSFSWAVHHEVSSLSCNKNNVTNESFTQSLKLTILEFFLEFLHSFNIQSRYIDANLENDQHIKRTILSHLNLQKCI